MRRFAGPLILDADGVFLSERPYWNAALGTALQAHGLAGRVRGRWDCLADLAFGPFGLQRVTKSAGCNSNWDLAAVLVRALDDEAWRGVVDEMLAAENREIEAMQALRAAAARLLRCEVNGHDPLSQFGIERQSEFFASVVDRFQAVLTGDASLGWNFERWQLKEPWEDTTRALSNLQETGYTLRVCTGRHRAEIEAPIRSLRLEPYLLPSEITSADETDRAESLSGQGSLGKPHWFAPACATVGFQEALGALENRSGLSGVAGYVGDAWADFAAVEACRDLGLDLTYVHVRSGVTSRDQERIIAESKATLAVITRLAVLGSLLVENRT
jgi:phosphoglycolate phosphatase-like HAD superfamily hydrolase